MKRLCGRIAIMFCAMGACGAMAQMQHHSEHTQQSPYAGQQNRAITSLSADDQQALLKGQGWGLAKSAELNGVPGPAHLLELADQIDLSTEQRLLIRALFEQMQRQAIVLGLEYIAAERALDDYFKEGQLNDQSLKEKVQEAAQARADLRFLHLSYHHRTLDIISPEQVQAYNNLRGYTNITDDPCANPPDGHDPEMFRKHMGCN